VRGAIGNAIGGVFLTIMEKLGLKLGLRKKLESEYDKMNRLHKEKMDKLYKENPEEWKRQEKEKEKFLDELREQASWMENGDIDEL